MVDQLLTIVLQHFVIIGLLAIAFGVLLNVAFTAGPDIMQAFRRHKLY